MRKLDDWIMVTIVAVIGYLFLSITTLEKADAVHETRYQHIIEKLDEIKGAISGKRN